jgi:hypothetical protein
MTNRVTRNETPSLLHLVCYPSLHPTVHGDQGLYGKLGSIRLIEMSSNRTTWAIAVLGFVVGIPLLYFLSIGPVIRFYYNKKAPAAIERFYAPVQWAWDETPLRGVIDWYSKLWEPKSTCLIIDSPNPN